MAIQAYRQVSATQTVTNGAATASVVAAQGANAVIYLSKALIAVTLAATGATGVVSLKDGTTVICSIDANTAVSVPVDFGDLGYPLTANTALNVVAESAGTNQASARVTVICHVVGG